MEIDSMGFAFMIMGIVFASSIIGGFIGMAIADSDTENRAIFTVEVMDKVCQELAGERYVYVDSEFLADSKFVCRRNSTISRVTKYDGIVIIQ